MNGDLFRCDTLQGLAYTIDGRSANNCFSIGSAATQTAYRLYVNGAAYVTGNLGCGGTKPFDIAWKDGKRLRHRCLEIPKACNAYRFTQACVAGENLIQLRSYFEELNTAGQVFASGADCFGQAYGSVSEDGSNTVRLICSTAGKHHVLVMADRNDLVAQQEWAEFGDEYPEP